MSELDMAAHAAKTDLMDSIKDLISIKNHFIEKIVSVAEAHGVSHQYLIQWAFEMTKLIEEEQEPANQNGDCEP